MVQQWDTVKDELLGGNTYLTIENKTFTARKKQQESPRSPLIECLLLLFGGWIDKAYRCPIRSTSVPFFASSIEHGGA